MNRIYTLKDVFSDFPITQKFGWTEFALKMWDRFKKKGRKLYKYGLHSGIDYGIKEGTEIRSPIDGVVVVDDDANDSGRGIAVSIWDKKQNIGCRFYHLSKNMVKINQKIKAGDIIGLSGKTAGELTIGNKAHLHFELVTTDEKGNATGNYGGAINPLGEKVIWH